MQALSPQGGDAAGRSAEHISEARRLVCEVACVNRIAGIAVGVAVGVAKQKTRS
jgi:hypothetical protein